MDAFVLLLFLDLAENFFEKANSNFVDICFYEVRYINGLKVTVILSFSKCGTFIPCLYLQYNKVIC